MAVAKVEKPIFTSPNGTTTTEGLQGTFDEPFWKRYFKWENLTVAGREVKGLVITPTMGLTLFLAIAGVVGAMHYRTADAIHAQTQEARELRDMVIRMDQRLMDKNTHDGEKFEQLDRRFNSTEAWQQVTNKELVLLKERAK